MKKVSFFAFALIFAGAVACNNAPAEDAADEAGDAVEEVADDAGEATEEAGDAVEDAMEDAGDAMEEATDTVTEAVEDAADAMEESVEEPMHSEGEHDHAEHADEM